MLSGKINLRANVCDIFSVQNGNKEVPTTDCLTTASVKISSLMRVENSRPRRSTIQFRTYGQLTRKETTVSEKEVDTPRKKRLVLDNAFRS